MFDVTAAISAHPAWPQEIPVPVIGGLNEIEITEENRESLVARGVSFAGPIGRSNKVIASASGAAIAASLSVHFNGATGNCVVLPDGSNLSGRISFEGHGHFCVCGGATESHNQIQAIFHTDGGLIALGKGGAAYGVTCVTEAGTCVIIGDDYLISYGVEVRSSDSHGVVDFETLERTNFPVSTIIGSHVWIAQHSIIGKGSRIGDFSLVGARSLVSGRFGSKQLIAGVPARVLKDNVSWSRAFRLSQDELSRMKGDATMDGAPSVEPQLGPGPS